jgi:hypothetical protein
LVKNIYRPSRQRVVGSQHLDVQGKGFTRRVLDPPDTANISGKQGFLGTSELKGVGRVVVDETNMLFSPDELMDMLYGKSSRYSQTSLLRMFIGGLINQNDPTLLLDEQTVLDALAYMFGIGENQMALMQKDRAIRSSSTQSSVPKTLPLTTVWRCWLDQRVNKP